MRLKDVFALPKATQEGQRTIKENHGTNEEARDLKNCRSRVAGRGVRCFVDLRRRTRPLAVLPNVRSVDRTIYATFNRFNQDWRNRTLAIITQNSNASELKKALTARALSI